MISLAQYLALQTPETLLLLFEKHGLDTSGLEDARRYRTDPTLGIRGALEAANDSQIVALMQEIARTEGDLRYRVNPKYRYDQRWRDLMGFLELDRFVVRDAEFRRTEPVIAGAPPLADDLRNELENSGLPRAAEVQRLIDQSVAAFTGADPDYNAALETHEWHSRL